MIYGFSLAKMNAFSAVNRRHSNFLEYFSFHCFGQVFDQKLPNRVTRQDIPTIYRLIQGALINPFYSVIRTQSRTINFDQNIRHSAIQAPEWDKIDQRSGKKYIFFLLKSQTLIQRSKHSNYNARTMEEERRAK